MSPTQAPLEEPLEHELDPELQTELQQHAGKWVAMTRSRLIAVGDSAADVYRRASDEGFVRPIIYRVPTDEGTVYFF